MLIHEAIDWLSFEVCQSGRVPEAFGERIGVYLQLGDELILVSRDGGKDGLWEDVGPVLLLFQVCYWS